MFIAEIFHSLQGEGVYTGHPSVFIRTSGCNLRCLWCDTPYTSWEVQGHHHTVNQLLAETARWSRTKHVVITGGEPMLQKDLPALLKGLHARGHFTTIETAGTLYDDAVRPAFFSISPKLDNARPGPQHPREDRLHQRNNSRVGLPRFIAGNVDFQFKFVVQGQADKREILGLVETFQIPRNKVMLMPEATSADQLHQREREVAQLCREEGFVFTTRLHIELWGNTRGT
ncbi:MAG: radical SAM protein [Candidatus Latescibacteria bacterium]|nr:radical SAM protein [Candidatus Latescibacterota bacterium]